MDIIERMDPFKNKDDLMYPEHMARYMFASQFTKNRSVIDCSCGNGYGSYYLAKHGAFKVLGIDIAQEAIDFSKGHYQGDNLEYVLGDATNLSEIPDASVDVFVCFETIEHIKDPSLMLEEIKRVITPNGKLVISCPNDNVFNPNNPFHCEIYTLEKFQNMASSFFANISLFMQNNTTGTSILPCDNVENANADQEGFSSLAYPVSARLRDNSDTWLLVCTNQEITESIYPVTTFFSTYSQYVLEVQSVNNSLYEENQKLSQSWETHIKTIHKLEEENEKLALSWERHSDHIKLLEDENKKLAESWTNHTQYIKNLEDENKKLADAWNTHSSYIKNLEAQIAKNRKV